MTAAEEGHADVVKLLLERGAGINSRSADGRTALHAAVGWDGYGGGRTRDGTFAAIKELLEQGADVNVKTKDGNTVLAGAVAFNSPEVVELLLNKGADVNAKNSRGETALMSAVRDPELVKILLDRGADVNAKDDYGITALMEASGRIFLGNAKAVTLLLDKGADVNARDKDGATALMQAIETGRRDNDLAVARALLDRGAEVNAKDKEGRTALMRLLEPSFTGHFESGRGSLKPGRSGDESSVPSSEFLRAQFEYGSPAVTRQEPASCKDTVRLLLEHGADANARDNDGRTALMRAYEPLIEIEGDRLMTVEEKGTAVTMKIKNGTVRIRRDLPKEIIELLRAHGAKE